MAGASRQLTGLLFSYLIISQDLHPDAEVRAGSGCVASMVARGPVLGGPMLCSAVAVLNLMLDEGPRIFIFPWALHII